MLRKLKKTLLAATLLAGFFSSGVYAQTIIAPAAPSLQATQLTNSRDFFPTLPASSICTKEKLAGIWKLITVYEVPSGNEMSNYINNPLQFYVFESDSRYGQYKSVLRAITLKDMRDFALNKIDGNQQFAINQSGMVFFYKNGVAVDSLACFIVANNMPPFRTGQLLLMPPQKAAAGTRMLKVYEKLYLEFEAPYNPPKTDEMAAPTQTPTTR